LQAIGSAKHLQFSFKLFLPTRLLLENGSEIGHIPLQFLSKATRLGRLSSLGGP
jgi:hypothetical protein